MSRIRPITWMGLTVLFVGCANFQAFPYTASVGTALALRQIAGDGVAVGDISATEGDFKEVSCGSGLGRLRPPSDLTYREYVKLALIQELMAGDRYDERSEVVLTGNLDSISLATRSGRWDIALTLSSTTGSSLSVESSYHIQVGFLASGACTMLAGALVPAVQQAISEAVGHPEFPQLMGADAGTERDPEDDEGK